jgi:quinol monooxygenase YgiN
MYGLIVTMKVREAQRAGFEHLVSALALAVKASEPGNLVYHVCRSRADPETYRIVEIYASKDAFKTHLAKDYVQQANPEVLKTLTGNPEVEVLEIVA